MDIFFIAVLAIMLVAFIGFHIGDAFSPWTLTTAVWLGIFILFQLLGDNLYPLQERLYACVAVWIPILVATSLLTYYAFPSKQIERKDFYFDVNKNVYLFLFVISMVFSPIYLYQMLKVVMMFSADDMMNNIRVLANYGEGDSTSTVLKYVNAVNQTLFIVELWRYPKGGKFRFYAVLVANMLCSVAIMSKTPLFLMFFTTLFILYEKGKINIGKIVLSALIVVFVFYGVNEMRRSEYEESSTFLDFFCMYIMSPSVAFEYAQEKLTDQYGTFSLAFFYAVISKLGLAHVYVQQQLQEFVSVPIPTNVYTVFQPYYEDFGYRGVAFFASVWGTFMGWVYRKCKEGHPFAKCIYAYLTVTLVMQFYQETFMVNLSILIQLSVLMWLLVQKKYSLRLV